MRFTELLCYVQGRQEVSFGFLPGGELSEEEEEEDGEVSPILLP